MRVAPTFPNRSFWRPVFRHANVALVIAAVACGGGSDVAGPPGGGGGAASLSTVTLDATTASVVVGATLTLNATPRDAQGNALSGHTVTWTTSDSTIASVSSAGLVTGKKVGTATITATSEGKSAAATVTVTAVAVASITLNASTATVVAGQKVTFTAVTKDASGNVLTGRTVTWGTSAAAVATVDANGAVSGVTPGTATITATSGTATASATVTVTAVPVASISVTPASDTLVSFGDTAVYSATPKDASGNALTGRTVTWTSSNDTIATVSATGVVKALHSGTATITASSGGQSGTATVVVPSVGQIVITPSTSSVRVGASDTLSVVLKDASGNQVGNRVVQVGNNNPTLISVIGTVITGVAPGTATVTYTAEGVSATATITVTP
jgi:trimeric autotransporter adhesin